MLYLPKNLRIILPLLIVLSSMSMGMTLSHARTIIDLNGDWAFSFEKEPAATVKVPHTWNAEDGADGLDLTKNKEKRNAGSVDADTYKRGTGTYSKELSHPIQKGKRYFLLFEGASQSAEVLVNGKKAGSHKGAFTAFCFEITSLLEQNGKNTVAVSVSNSPDPSISPLTGDFTMYGGLYRPVSLIETDDVCIQPDYFASPGVFISQEKVSHSEAIVKVDTLVSSISATSSPVKVEVTILDPRGYVAASSVHAVTPVPGKTLRNSQELTLIHPLLWQGRDNPYLHKVQVTLTGPDGQTDQVEQHLGLRNASIDPQKGFVLNDYYYKLRGVNRHQDREGKGWAISPEEEKQDMKLITEMGATALRTAHYPQSKHWYDLCDQAGLIVWTEIPVINRTNNTPEFRENLKQQATEMILQHGNHPSICMWGFFNEIHDLPNNPATAAPAENILEELQEYIKKLDPQRFTTGATDQRQNDRLNHLPDHLAVNVYPGWYLAGAEKMKDILSELGKHYPGKGIAVSEYGHGASIHMHENPVKQPSPSSRWHPEEWQALGHEINYEAIKNAPGLWGSFVWNMFDFGADVREEGEKEGINDKGLVTYDRKTPKDAYYFYKANWNPALMAHIASGRFTQRVQQEIPVKVYSNAHEVTLTLNGKQLDTRKPDAMNRALWEKVRLIPGENTIEVSATRNGETARDQCKWIYTLSGNPPVDEYDATFQKDKEIIP